MVLVEAVASGYLGRGQVVLVEQRPLPQLQLLGVGVVVEVALVALGAAQDSLQERVERVDCMEAGVEAGVLHFVYVLGALLPLRLGAAEAGVQYV
jgi:hypothetical protein